MISAVPTASAEELLRDFHALAGRFTVLARACQERLVPALQAGTAPDEEILRDLGDASAAYRPLADRAARQVGAGPNTASLPAIIAALEKLVREAAWAAVREECREDVGRGLRLAHKSTPPPSFWSEFQERARDYLVKLDGPPLAQAVDREAWSARVQPFRDLWSVVQQPETLTDAAAEEAVARLQDAFGRNMVAAVTLRRVFLPPPCAAAAAPESTDTVVERGAPAGDKALATAGAAANEPLSPAPTLGPVPEAAFTSPDPEDIPLVSSPPDATNVAVVNLLFARESGVLAPEKKPALTAVQAPPAAQDEDDSIF
jgi:hypothetical protein